jgi:release factor glutamine methyltransferase
MPLPSIAQALSHAKERLAALPQAAPRLEAELLLGAALERPRSYLFAWPERALTAAEEARWQALLARRLAGSLSPTSSAAGSSGLWSWR